jgi:hypothetical protein
MPQILAVPPSLFTNGHLWDSSFQNSEKETVAGNIITLSKRNDDQWVSFTWERYCELCIAGSAGSHHPTWRENDVLDSFVRERVLAKASDGTYSVTDLFITTLFAFTKGQPKYRGAQ